METGPELWGRAEFGIFLHYATLLIEAAGVLVIVLGALVAFAVALGAGRGGDGGSPYHLFRQKFGRTILLGLELLVAADIIGTVAIEPTLDNALILALIVLIRTFLSISLTVEIEGRWPWQSARPAAAERINAGGER